MRSQWAVRVVLGLSLLGITVGLLMWAQADSGTKAVDLGSGLVATGFFGLLFIGLERALGARVTESTEAVGGLLPKGADTHDDGAPEDSGDAPRPTAVAPPLEQFPHEYHAEFVGWQVDHSRVDASQVRVRIYRDEEYFQFFTGVVPGIVVEILGRGGPDGISPRLQRACARVVVRAAKERIVDGSVPLADPSNASEVLLSHDAIEVAMRRGGLKDEPMVEGDELERWVL